MNTYFIVGFRPLSRYIGLYHIRVVKDKFQPNMFPSPLEVYRFISRSDCEGSQREETTFPSPLEVYRFISLANVFVTSIKGCFRPLSRYIGLYQSSIYRIR